MIIFQVILILLLLIFSMGSVAEKQSEVRVHYVSITIACILALCFTYWIGIHA